MSNPWFRVYAGLIDDPKFIKLGPDVARALMMMWCVACQNDGRLPPLEDMAIKFRMSEARTAKMLDELRHCGFIDDDKTGPAPHNWNERQYKSDVSTNRVKQFRQRQGNVSSAVSETPPDTEQKQRQNRTDSEADASAARAKRTRAVLVEAPDRPTEKAINFAVSHGWDLPKIQTEWQRFRDHSLAKGKRHRDVDAAWRNWVTSPFQQNGAANGQRPGFDRSAAGQSGSDAVLAGVAAAADRRARQRGQGRDQAEAAAAGEPDFELFGAPGGAAAR